MTSTRAAVLAVDGETRRSTWPWWRATDPAGDGDRRHRVPPAGWPGHRHGATQGGRALGQSGSRYRPDRPDCRGGTVLSLPGRIRPPHSHLDAALRATGLTRRTIVSTDCRAGLRAGSDRGWGVIVICGSGYPAASPGWQGCRVRGAGPDLGDWGGGGDVGRAALAAAVRARDGRGPHTILEQHVPAHFGVTRPIAVTEALAAERLKESRSRAGSCSLRRSRRRGRGIARHSRPPGRRAGDHGDRRHSEQDRTEPSEAAAPSAGSSARDGSNDHEPSSPSCATKRSPPSPASSLISSTALSDSSSIRGRLAVPGSYGLDSTRAHPGCRRRDDHPARPARPARTGRSRGRRRGARRRGGRRRSRASSSPTWR